MLPKRHRLNLKKEKFLKGDAQLPSQFFKLVVKKGVVGGPKIGFIVSGKVGSSVTRNKVKRILSESVEKKIDRIPNNLSLIFIAFPQSAGVTYREIDSSVDKILPKIQI